MISLSLRSFSNFLNKCYVCLHPTLFIQGATLCLSDSSRCDIWILWRQQTCAREKVIPSPSLSAKRKNRKSLKPQQHGCPLPRPFAGCSVCAGTCDSSQLTFNPAGSSTMADSSGRDFRDWCSSSMASLVTFHTECNGSRCERPAHKRASHLRAQGGVLTMAVCNFALMSRCQDCTNSNSCL